MLWLSTAIPWSLPTRGVAAWLSRDVKFLNWSRLTSIIMHKYVPPIYIPSVNSQLRGVRGMFITVGGGADISGEDGRRDDEWR